jgi:hypothetical protein
MYVSVNCTMTREDFLLSVTTARPPSSYVILDLLPDFRNDAVTYSYLTGVMMEAASASETSINFYQATWRYNPEDSHLQLIFA